MSTSQKRDADMDRLLRAVLQPKPRGSAGACPGPELLAAFVEGGLTANEQSALDAHVVGCSRCQEALAILSHDVPAQEEETVAPPERGWFTWATRPRLRWLVPISAAATVAVVFFATRPLIAPESEEAFPSDVVQLAQAPPPPTTLPAEGMEAAREKSAAVPEKREETGTARREDAAKSLTGQFQAPKESREVLADASPSGRSGIDRKPAEPAAEMMAARVAAEDKRTQPAAAPVPPVPSQLVKAASEFGRGAGASGAPARAVRNVEAGLVTVSAPGGTVLWRFGPGGRLLRSADGGESWQPQASGATADLLAGDALSPFVCWVVGSAGAVLLTTDGERWTCLPFPLAVDLVAVEASGASAAIVTARDGRRFATLDAGLTWFPKQ